MECCRRGFAVALALFILVGIILFGGCVGANHEVAIRTAGHYVYTTTKINAPARKGGVVQAYWPYVRFESEKGEIIIHIAGVPECAQGKRQGEQLDVRISDARGLQMRRLQALIQGLNLTSLRDLELPDSGAGSCAFLSGPQSCQKNMREVLLAR